MPEQRERYGRQHGWIWAAVFWAVAWLIWFDSELGSLIVGLPLLCLSVALFRRLGQGRFNLRIIGVVRLIRYFLVESVKGGWDVARRTFSRRLDIDPVLVEFESPVAAGPARAFLMNCISLLPGTTVVEREEGRLLLHVLSGSRTCLADVKVLEDRIAAAFPSSLKAEELDAS